MGILKYNDKDQLNYTCEGWYIRFKTPFTIDNMFDSPYDIERTRANTDYSCFCGTGCRDQEWTSIVEWQIPDYPLGYLFNTKEEALEKFHKLVKAYGKNLKFEDIFVSIHHCVIEQKFTQLDT